MEKKRFVKEYIEPIIIAVLIALFVRTFIVQAFKIPSSSMEPTLLVGDYLLVNKFLYGTRIPFTDKKILEFKKTPKGRYHRFHLSQRPVKGLHQKGHWPGGGKS